MAAYPVLQGAEPFYFEGNETGILVLHGFTGTTQSMRGLGEQFAEAGYTVCGPRLKGHGTHYEDMETTTYQDWIQSVEEGFEWLQQRCHRIFVTGLSMGGTLTLHLAAKYETIAGIVLINAAVNIPDMENLNEADIPRFIDAIGSDIKKEGVTELAYDKTPVKSMKEIATLMQETRGKLSPIHCPALIFVSKDDHVVPPDNASYIYDHIASTDKKKLELSDSYHVATLDHDKDYIAQESLAFIRNN